MIWIAWPKKASGVATDLNENIVREIGLAAGLVDTKVCAIDETWSGLRFVIRRSRTGSSSSLKNWSGSGHIFPGTAEEEQIALDELTPREIVSELDKYVVGQHEAKRAVAIALRNRMRRQKLTPELAEEVIPKNIIMIGPTGVGKTEIARRLAKLANSPFLKVEASKFTEVGYVGRDVESMIRDLIEIAIDMVREEKLEDVADKAELNAEERLLDLLLAASRRWFRPTAAPPQTWASVSATIRCRRIRIAHARETAPAAARRQARRAHRGTRSAREVMPAFEIISNQGVEEMDINMKDMLPEHLRPAHQEAEDEGQRGVRLPDRRKKSSA